MNKNEDVIGVLGEVHNVPHVFEEKMTLDVLIEGESSGLCFSEVLQSESRCFEDEPHCKNSEVGNVKKNESLQKPILHDVQIYQTPKVCVPKVSNVQIRKDEEVVQIRNSFLKPRNQKRKQKKNNKKKSKMKKVWMPKMNMLEVGEKRKENLVLFSEDD
uniref:Uncharacterized protein n=1 Tax=Lactuca sativa TaxID=4236 RepID=A0A9R1UZE6_LACSA|nr:hypothetical protein LSAT_V11C700351660 [Lactuca sativa]